MALLLPLEERLRRLASEKPNEFPNRSASYFERYVAIKDALEKAYFSVAGAGLALKGERYTRHDRNHVDDVIMTAGRLLGADVEGLRCEARLEPYELYVLLLAILLHDAGNASGREGHERRAGAILRELGRVADLEPAEIKLIASIARAHGGLSASGDRDTISSLERRANVSHQHVHSQRLAATLRLADEFSENPRRADPGALRGDSGSPAESVIHNLFCKLVNIDIAFEEHTIRVSFDIERPMLSTRYVLERGSVNKTTFLIDYVRARLEKGELERRYCNRFLAGWAPYERIRVTINIVEQDEIVDVLAFDLEDKGYPTVGPDWPRLAPDLDGAKLQSKHEGAMAIGGDR